MAEFNPADKKHLVKLQGVPYITVVGLQARLADQGKAVVETDTEMLLSPFTNEEKAAIVKFSCYVLDKNGNKHGPFSALGDASAETVNSKLAGATLRMAETRAYGRVLRIATRSNYTAFEELPTNDETEGV